MKPQDKKLLIGGGVGIAALVYFTRRRASAQGFGVERHEHRKHEGHGDEHDNKRGEYGKKKHHHHEDR